LPQQADPARGPQLAELEAKLFSNEQATSTIAIVGPGGTGKSQLALEVAHRTRQNNKHCSVFWMDASDKDSLYQSYASVAQKLGIPGWDDDQPDMKRIMQQCVAELSARQCLLIFDNAEDAVLRSCGSSTAEAVDLADYLPQSTLCSIVFTTTNSDTAETLAPNNIIALRELTPDTALRMLQNHLATLLSDTGQLREAELLLRELSYLPLAVVQAAACINASGMPVHEYRAQLGHKKAAFEHSSSSLGSKLYGHGIDDPVVATLFVSMSHVYALATNYLFFAAVKEYAVKVLEKYALITRRPADSALDLHRLVHRALREDLQKHGRLQQWTQRTITQLLQVFPDSNHSNRSKWRRLLPHVQFALSHSQGDNDDKQRVALARNCAMTLLSDGSYEEAEKLFVQVMETSKTKLGADHPSTLTSMANLASTFRNQGRWEEAEKLDVQVMETRKTKLGGDHRDTLTSMANLAFTWKSLGQTKKAICLIQQCVQRCEQVLGASHPYYLSSLLVLEQWEGEQADMELFNTFKDMRLGRSLPLGCSNLGLWEAEAGAVGGGGWGCGRRRLGLWEAEVWDALAGDEPPIFTVGSFREIAHQAKVCGRKDRQADVYKLVHNWLRDAKNGRWLLVLDNADDAGVFSARASDSQAEVGGSSALTQHLSSYLPYSKHDSVLVTSRTRHAATEVVEDNDVISIEPMDDAAAQALLYRKLGDDGNKGGTDDGITELARALEYMPLALVQVGVYIRIQAPRCSVRQYLEEYHRSDKRKTKLLEKGVAKLPRDKAASNSILIMWQISFDYI
ncbi:hypothetical protein PSPO01_16409, partial [Paraphaeosphaeria sporulosa]